MSKKEYELFVMISLLLTSITPFIYTAHAEAPGELAPDFTLTDIDGNGFSLSDYRDKVVLLDFFATTCIPCLDAIPRFKAIYDRYEGNLIVISISVYPHIDSADRLKQLRDDYGITWTIARDTDDNLVSYKYTIQVIPTLFIIDKDGYIRYRSREGLPEGSVPEVIEEIDELMKSPSSISCNLSSSSIDIGSSVIIHGEIHPPRLAQVKIEVSKDDGITWSDLTSVTSTPDGNYSHEWTPDTAGLYQIKAYWLGDAEYTGATSPTISLTVVGLSSQISCQLSTTKVIQILVYGSVTISGLITPAIPDVTITIYYSADEATWSALATVNTDGEGRYSYTWTSQSLGTYYIRAVWPGDATYEGAVSATASVTIEDYTWLLIIPIIVTGVAATYLFEKRKVHKKKKKKGHLTKLRTLPAFSPAKC